MYLKYYILKKLTILLFILYKRVYDEEIQEPTTENKAVPEVS